MLRSRPAIQAMQIKLQDNEKKILTVLSQNLSRNLKQDCRYFFNENGDMVLETTAETLVGFRQINSFLNQNGIILSTVYYQRLHNIATKFEFVADVIQQLKIKKLLDVFKTPTPDIKKVLAILENPKNVIRATRYFFERPESRTTQLLKTTRDFKDPFIEISQLDFFLTEVLDCPMLLSIYVEAITHPVLGKLIYYLIHFKKANITLAVPDGAHAVNNFEQLFQLFESENAKHLAVNPVIDELINEMLNFSISDLNDKDVPDDKIAFLMQLVQAVGKRYLSTLRGQTSFITTTKLHTFNLTFFEAEKEFLHSLKQPANQLAWQKIKDVVNHQPLELKDPGPSLDLEHRDYVTDLTTRGDYEIGSLFHKIIYEIAYKKAVFPQEHIALMQKLAGVVAPHRFHPFFPRGGRHFPSSSDFCRGTDLMAVDIGDVVLFKAIVERIDKDSDCWKKAEKCLRTIVQHAVLSVDIKLQMIMVVAECDVRADTHQTIFGNTVLRNAYVAFVTDVMECILVHLSRDTTGLVQSYLDESVLKLAREEIGRRFGLFAAQEKSRVVNLVAVDYGAAHLIHPTSSLRS